MKKLALLILIFVIGGLGGVFFDRLAVPYLRTKAFFGRFGFFSEMTDGTVIINKKEEIVIRENQAIEEAINKMNSVVGIEVYEGNKLINQVSGIVVTTDGLIVTYLPEINAKSKYEFNVYYENNKLQGQLFNRSAVNGLVLIKIDKDNMPVSPFVPANDLKLGERVVLVGLGVKKGVSSKFIELGVIEELNKDGYITNFYRSASRSINGSAIIDTEGTVIGMIAIDETGLSVIRSDALSAFLDKMIEV